MLLKDYYTILEVPPLATAQEIKKSFRRLALQYHPDKNKGSRLAEAKFREIQEAYEILSDAKQREQYNYKRWYQRSAGQPFTSRPLTPIAILEECRQLRDYVGSMSIFHVNYENISRYIRNLLSDSTIGILQEHHETGVNRTIIQTVLQASAPLPLRYLLPITTLLEKLAGDDTEALQTIKEYIKTHQQRHRWDKYKWLVVVLVTALLCLLMYLFGR